jgi:hypothetical protein
VRARDDGERHDDLGREIVVVTRVGARDVLCADDERVVTAVFQCTTSSRTARGILWISRRSRHDTRDKRAAKVFRAMFMHCFGYGNA